MAAIRSRTARRRRSNSAAPTPPAVPAGRLPGRRSAAEAGRRPHLRSRPARQSAVIDGGRSSGRPGCSAPTANDIINRRQRDPGARRLPERPRQTRRQGFEARRRIQVGAMARLCQLQLHRRHLSVHRRFASPNNPSADADGNIHVVPGKRIPDPAAPVQGRRRLR